MNPTPEIDGQQLRETLEKITLNPGENEDDGSSDFLVAVAGEVPPTVYHYTSAQVIHDVVSKQRLWASNARFLNDTTEILHGLDLCRERLLARKGAREHFATTAVKILDKNRDMDNARGFEEFVVCFSDGADLVPQWKGYAADGAGFALGFDIVAAARASDTAPYRVIYGERDQRIIVDAAIDGYLGVLDRSLAANPIRKEETARAVGSSLVTMLTQLLASFKHEVFAHEKEWRLVEHLPRSDARRSALIQFRPARGILLPFVELSIKTENGGLPD